MDKGGSQSLDAQESVLASAADIMWSALVPEILLVQWLKVVGLRICFGLRGCIVGVTCFHQVLVRPAVAVLAVRSGPSQQGAACLFCRHCMPFD
jgi:hypothetical protein